MKRTAAVLAAGAVGVGVAILPAAAATFTDDGAPTSVSAAEPGVQAVDGVGAQSDMTLAATGFGFLLLGAGTLSLAHRRRWRTIDLRVATVDAHQSHALDAKS